MYSNEAGQGTAPIYHSTAKTDHPARQGLWGVTEVFFDTFVICSLTALAILTTGSNLLDVSPAIMAAKAFGSVSPFLSYIEGISLILFAYTCLIGAPYVGTTLFTWTEPLQLDTFSKK